MFCIDNHTAYVLDINNKLLYNINVKEPLAILLKDINYIA